MKPYLCSNSDGENGAEYVTAIEYHKYGMLWGPFSVMTSERDSHGSCGNTYDFDWSKSRKEIFYHMSGCGWSEFPASGFVKPAPCPAKLWIADGVKVVSNDGKRRRSLNAAQLFQLGYKVIDAPLDLTRFSSLGEKTIDPFDVGSESEVEWCSVCKSYIPTEELCVHIDWCESCGWYVNIVTRQRTDGISKCRHAGTAVPA